LKAKSITPTLGQSHEHRTENYSKDHLWRCWIWNTCLYDGPLVGLDDLALLLADVVRDYV